MLRVLRRDAWATSREAGAYLILTVLLLVLAASAWARW